MTSANAAVREECRLTEFLVDSLGSRLSGQAYGECVKNYPRDVYFVGNLRSDDMPKDHDGAKPHLPELLNKLAPVAFGTEFKLGDRNGGTAKVELHWSCYYRVFPLLDEQKLHSRALVGGAQSKKPREPAQENVSQTEPSEDGVNQPSSIEEDAEESENAPPETAKAEEQPGRGVSNTDELMLKFRKIRCCASGNIILSVSDGGVWNCDLSALEQSIQAELVRASTIVNGDLERIRAPQDPYEKIRVPEAAMATQTAYDVFKKSLPTVVVPHWKWETRASVRTEGDDAGNPVFAIMFVNGTSRQLSGSGKDHPCIESFLFDATAGFDFANYLVVPFTIDLAPKGFRYDPSMWARAFNCSVQAVDPPLRFRTRHLPVFSQSRLVTRAEPIAPFSELSVSPGKVLQDVLDAMIEYRSVWDSQRVEYQKSDPEWLNRHGAEFDRDCGTFVEEIERFRRGCELIRTNDDVALAFRLTNETFLRSGRHVGKTSWRLFQLVFLVSQIPGVASLITGSKSDAADLEYVDIVYFPTGGGKTEAYLSVLAFNCFFDRLRNKTAGVTAWTRFPLRLLTLQQTQRVADIICVADLVRRSSPDQRLSGKNIAGFGVGYFVGKTSTPNELVSDKYKYAKAEDLATWAAASDDTQRQNWRRLIHCPSCWTNTVRIEFDPDHARLIHKCSEAKCDFPDGRIPVYVVDNEIYRYLPSVLVGTIDKLAGIGNQRKMALIFGSVDGICAKHGYYKAKCCQKDCDNKSLAAKVPPGLTGPTLFVQDELHLLKEGLGTFDGHYETFVQELLKEITPGSPLKIIASSATIEKFERQVEHLYGVLPTLARIFPGPGPRLGESFYAHTLDYPQRRFVGLVPHNKTIFNAMLELLEHYHRIVQELINLPASAGNPYGGTLQPQSDAWFRLLDLYVTSLSYFLSSRDLNSLHTDLDGHVSPLLQAEQFSPLHVLELTGSTTTDDVATTLEFLARAKPDSERATTVLATNMVSHGVDIDRLNAMFFYGMPRQNAEYIQASSRVGRSHLGLVFVCHHPARERDRSHYSVFDKYHEYLGQLVEPVAINRWATFSVNRTLPGLFMGILLQVIAGRGDPKKVGQFSKTDYVRQQISSGTIRAGDFVPFLERSYRLGLANPQARQQFRNEIRIRVQQFLDNIVQAGTDKTFVSETLIPHPMTSLRDVDEPIPIALDRAGTQWAGQNARAGVRQ